MGIIKKEDFALITFPGVMLYNLIYKLFCHISLIEIKNVEFFAHNYPSGYVEHENPKNIIQSLIIFILPFIFLSFVSILIFSVTYIFKLNIILKIILIWLGMSIAVQSFPDSNVISEIKKNAIKLSEKNFLGYLLYPFYAIFTLFHLLSILGFYILYAVFIYFLVTPEIIISLFI